MTGQSLEFITQFESETWSRCADIYLDGFAVLTRSAVVFTNVKERIDA